MKAKAKTLLAIIILFSVLGIAGKYDCEDELKEENSHELG